MALVESDDAVTGSLALLSKLQACPASVETSVDAVAALSGEAADSMAHLRCLEKEAAEVESIVNLKAEVEEEVDQTTRLLLARSERKRILREELQGEAHELEAKLVSAEIAQGLSARSNELDPTEAHASLETERAAKKRRLRDELSTKEEVIGATAHAEVESAATLPRRLETALDEVSEALEPSLERLHHLVQSSVKEVPKMLARQLLGIKEATEAAQADLAAEEARQEEERRKYGDEYVVANAALVERRRAFLQRAKADQRELAARIQQLREKVGGASGEAMLPAEVLGGLRAACRPLVALTTEMDTQLEREVAALQDTLALLAPMPKAAPIPEDPPSIISRMIGWFRPLKPS